jgi:hypothetical protein
VRRSGRDTSSLVEESGTSPTGAEHVSARFECDALAVASSDRLSRSYWRRFMNWLASDSE